MHEIAAQSNGIRVRIRELTTPGTRTNPVNASAGFIHGDATDAMDLDEKEPHPTGIAWIAQ